MQTFSMTAAGDKTMCMTAWMNSQPVAAYNTNTNPVWHLVKRNSTEGRQYDAVVLNHLRLRPFTTKISVEQIEWTIKLHTISRRERSSDGVKLFVHFLVASQVDAHFAVQGNPGRQCQRYKTQTARLQASRLPYAYNDGADRGDSSNPSCA